MNKKFMFFVLALLVITGGFYLLTRNNNKDYSPIGLDLDSKTKITVMVVQIVAGLTMIFSIYLGWRQLSLQKTEVIKQNQKIIELLTEIRNKK